MAQSLMSHNLKAFELMRRAAAEYNKAEYKFYMSGFFKFVQEDSVYFIDDVYIMPEHRGTPVAQDMLTAFTEYMVKNKIFMYYGKVYKNAKGYEKRIKTFKEWGMVEVDDNDLYTTVSKLLVKE